MKSRLAFLAVAILSVLPVISIPPSQCFANFRWDDCGRKPEAVMYYWKPGSRCEIGLWRGCLPNINMFKDEYECVSTCIFAVRANALDYHKNQEEDDTNVIEETETNVINETKDDNANNETAKGPENGPENETDTKNEAEEGEGEGEQVATEEVTDAMTDPDQ